MFRLLKYAPLVIPVVSKFVKSPQGQRLIAKAKTRLSGSNGGSTGRSAGRGR